LALPSNEKDTKFLNRLIYHEGGDYKNIAKSIISREIINNEKMKLRNRQKTRLKTRHSNFIRNVPTTANITLNSSFGTQQKYLVSSTEIN